MCPVSSGQVHDAPAAAVVAQLTGQTGRSRSMTCAAVIVCCRAWPPGAMAMCSWCPERRTVEGDESDT